MLKEDGHKRALDRLEAAFDLDWVEETELVHQDLWEGKPCKQLPCIVSTPTPPDWPAYPFKERWDDMEKNFVNRLGGIYTGALLRDDRVCQIEPDYGVVHIPELFGVPSVVTNEGNAMSEGLNDRDKIRAIVKAGIPPFASALHEKVEAWQDFARTVLSQYEKLSQAVHFTIPNLQGPFDLACLIWGRDIFMALYDEPDLVEALMDLVTDSFIQYGLYQKKRTGDPIDSTWHAAGVRLVHGGVRVCDDSAVMVSGDIFRNLIRPRDLRAFEPFHGGWVHYCGDGNHFIADLLEMEPVHYLHLGNPDYHDFLDIARRIADKQKILVWSGSLDRIREALEITGYRNILALPENRYGATDLEDARWRLEQARRFQPLPKRAW